MIYTDLKFKNQNETLPKIIKECIEFVNKTDILNTFEIGMHILKDLGVKMSFESYNSKTLEEGTWESHLKYLDVQIILEGEENIYVNSLENLVEKSTDLEKDLILYDEKKDEVKGVEIPLRKGKVLVLYPEDGHMPGIRINETKQNKKIVFKVPIEKL